MDKQKKARELQLEFCQWLVTNAKQLQLESSQGLNMIAKAKNINEVDKGLEKLTEELGGPDKLQKIVDTWQQSKSQNMPIAKNGAKINYLVSKFKEGGPNDDYPQSQSDTTFVKRWYPEEDGITYENKIHVRRYPYWRHSHPAARWQTENEEYVELITPQNDTLYFNSYYDANHIGNRSNEYEDKENQKKLFDKHRNRKVWDDLGW